MKKVCLQMEEGLNLRSHYVDIRLVRRNRLCLMKKRAACLEEELAIMGDMERQQSSLGWSQIFESSAVSQPKRSVLVLGNAGIGKTTLIQSLGLEWSNGSFPQFDFFFLLDGKDLALTKPTFSLQTLLLGGLSPKTPLCSGSDIDLVFRHVTAAPERVLAVFDGFQETRHLEPLLQGLEKGLAADLQRNTRKQSYTVKQLYSAMLQRVLLPGCTLLIAARPRGATGCLSRWADSLLELCGFSDAEVQGALSRYFTEPASLATALTRLESSPYLSSLCWNPALFSLVCFVLQHTEDSETLPDTLSGLCYRALSLKLAQVEDTFGGLTLLSARSQVKLVSDVRLTHRSLKQVQVNELNKKKGTRSHTRKGVGNVKKKGTSAGKKTKSDEGGDEEELLAQLSRLAWEGVQQNDLVLSPGEYITATVRQVGLRVGLFCSSHLLGRLQEVSPGGSEEGGGGGGGGQVESADKKDNAEGEGGSRGSEERPNTGRTMKTDDDYEDSLLSWSNAFLRSFLAGLHISSTRKTSGTLKTFPMQAGIRRVRRQAQKEELDLVQRFAIGTLFLETQCSDNGQDMASKQTALIKYLEKGLGRDELKGAHLLEVCHYIYETVVGSGDREWGTLLAHVLTKNVQREMTFQGVRMWPSDVYVVGKVLELVGREGAGFCLSLDDTGIQKSGILSLLGLGNIVTYRACTADVISLWEELEEKEEELHLKGVMSKFKLNPKATQVFHVDGLAHLVSMHRRLMSSSSQSDSVLASGIPAVTELHKLELALDPEDCTLALPKLWSLLPGLCNLRHLDLEKSKLGDEGAEALAPVLESLSNLEILNLSQNGIGDSGVYDLSQVLMTPASLRCLSLYSNMISDNGVRWLAKVLPRMLSLTDLDVKYNNLTDFGARCLGASLKKCPSVKSLRMWNKRISFGVFERLQKQDSRIMWH